MCNHYMQCTVCRQCAVRNYFMQCTAMCRVQAVRCVYAVHAVHSVHAV